MIAPREFIVPVDRSATTALLYTSDTGVRHRPILMLAHGAGAGQRSPWMVSAARALAALEVDVVTFNFLYTEQRRRIPDRAPALETCYRAAIEAVRRDLLDGRPLFIGGKSMGGRIATQVAAADPDLPIAGLVLLGYPLHPPGRPEQRRDAHLPAIVRPVLFVQGSRDAFGSDAEIAALLPTMASARLSVVSGGDHSLKIARAEASRQAEVFQSIARDIVQWMARIL